MVFRILELKECRANEDTVCQDRNVCRFTGSGDIVSARSASSVARPSVHGRLHACHLHASLPARHRTVFCS